MELPRQSDDIIGQSQVTVRLLELTQKTNYELVQENGQRRLTAPEFASAEAKDRIKGAEIFLGRLPRDCYEDEIMPVLQRVGRFLELRLMLDFSGSTRGYAFALFPNAAVARHACNILDGYEIRPGHKIGVVKSVDNCRLFFGGVPKDKTKADFVDELGKLLDGIVEIYLYPNAHDRTQNRGFIFVEFKDHRSAAMARRKLIPGKVILWNHEIAVDWADPEPGELVDDDIMETVSALFIRNLTMDTPHQSIRDIFQKTTGIPVLKMKKINHFAFIHYQTREQAQFVLNTMTQPGGIAEREDWEIRWAKPIESCKADRQRTINEAIAANCGTIEDRASAANASWKKSSHKKRSYKKTSQENRAPNPADGKINYPQLLQCFVAQKLHASCSFDCFPSFDHKGHTCKVTIATENEILFEFQSNVYRSKQKAIEVAAGEVYRHVRQSFPENQELLLTCANTQESLGSLRKFEACR